MPSVKMKEMKDSSAETLTLDITEDMVKKLNIGEKVEIILKGSIGMLQVPPEGTTEFDGPMLGLRLTSKKIIPSNKFADLASDDDDDDADVAEKE